MDTASVVPAKKAGLTRSNSLPSKLDKSLSLKGILATFQSRTVTATHYEIPQVWSKKSTVFPYWHEHFFNNTVLVSDQGFPKDNHGDNLAAINGTPCHIRQVSTIPSGHLSIPPFFQTIDKSNELSFSFIGKSENKIQSAKITIIKYFPDLEECDYVSISEKDLKTSVISHTKDIPIIKDQAYYSESEVMLVKKHRSRSETSINIIFKVTNLTPECKEDSIIFFDEKNTQLEFKSDLDTVRIVLSHEMNEFCFPLTKNTDINGSNGLTLTSSKFEELELRRFKRPVMLVNNMAFLIRGRNRDPAKVFWCNTSALRSLGTTKSLSETDQRLIDSGFPDATSMSMKIKWLERDDQKNVKLPETEQLELLARTALKDIPLQEGKFCQIPVESSDKELKVIEAIITQVSGEKNDLPKEEKHPEVYWLSEQTKIELNEYATNIKTKTETEISESEPILKQITKKVAGIEGEAEKIIKEVVLPLMLFPEGKNNLPVPTGMILHGPTGTGKTTLALALADILRLRSQVRKVPVRVVKGPELESRWLGESEKSIRELFDPAEADYNKHGRHSPLHVIVIDEVDALLAQRTDDGSSGARSDNKMVAQFLTCTSSCQDQGNILFIGTTNRFDAIDNAIKRSGRFGRHYEIDTPKLNTRVDILKLHAKKSVITVDLTDSDYVDIAKKTEGRSGAFLESIIQKSEMIAISENHDLKALSIEKIKMMANNSSGVTINSRILQKALDESLNDTTVEDTLAKYIPATATFLTLECQKSVTHSGKQSSGAVSANSGNALEPRKRPLNDDSITETPPRKVAKIEPSTFTANSAQPSIENCVSYMERVFRSQTGLPGVILIEGKKQSGKTHVAHHLVKEVKANHVSIINLDELTDDFSAVKLLNDNLKKSRGHNREVIIIENFDLLLNESFKFKSCKNVLMKQIDTYLNRKEQDYSRIFIITSCKPIPNHPYGHLVANRKLQLEELTQSDITKILEDMGTTDSDIRKIKEIFQKKVLVGDFMRLIGPCVSQPDQQVADWNLEALEEDVSFFYEESPESSSLMYT